MRRFALLLLFAGSLPGETTMDLEQPLSSAKARRLREEGQALWKPFQPLWEKLRAGQEVAPAEAAAALPAVEQAIEILERSLREEWHGDTNRALADAVRTWFRLCPLAPASEASPNDAARAKARQKRVEEVRRFVMEYGRERRFESLCRICSNCQGRKAIVSPFGDRRDCTACEARGRLLDRAGIVKARWLRFSPLHRAEANYERDLNSRLRARPPTGEGHDPFAPYIRSVAIQEVEDHDVWARVKVREQLQPAAFSSKTEKTDATYVLFRAGKVWYLYDEHTDRDLLDLGGP